MSKTKAKKKLDSDLIRVKTTTKKQLDKLGNKNDSYDDIVRRLIELTKVGEHQ